MSNIIGIRNNNTILPYSGATKRTKHLDLSSYIALASGADSISNVVCTGYAYADSLGNWRLSFNCGLTIAGATGTISFAFNIGTVFPSGTNAAQAVYGGNTATGTTTTYLGATGANNNTITFWNSANATTFAFSGDLKLAGEPSFAAANMEGVTAVDVYIPPASATSAGLLSYYATGTHSTTIGNMLASAPTAAISWVRVNNQVTISLDAVVDAPSKANNVAPFTITPLPVALRPSVVRSGPAFILQNGSHDVGIIYVAVDGSVTWYRNWDALAWTASVGARLQPTSFTYNL
jgi:hypothetical protein